MSDVEPNLDAWQAPDTAGRVVTLIGRIAKKAVDDAITYRMAVVKKITATTIDIEFSDEPGNTISIPITSSIRPKNAGQNVEIEVRNGTEFYINKVFGDTFVAGTTQPDVVAPEVPTGLSLTTNARAVLVAWDLTDGATAYDVQSTKDPRVENLSDPRRVGTNSFTQSNLTAGEGWYFRVRAVNSSGESEYSSYESIVVAGTGDDDQVAEPVSTLTVTPGELLHNMYWPIGRYAQYYELQWTKDESFSAGITTQVVQGNTFSRSDLTLGDTWFYRVRSVSGAGSTDWSVVVSAAVESKVPEPAGPPVKVTGLAMSSSNRSISVLWTPQEVATSYKLERATDALFTIGLVRQTVQGSNLTINNLIADQEWFFRVRGVNAAGEGEWSDVRSTLVYTDTPEPGAPGQVTGLDLSTIPSQIVAKWGLVADAEEYEVQRSLDPTLNGGVISERVDTNSLIATKLNGGENWHFRVRAINSADEGPWSATVSKVVILTSEYTDGDPPENSPPVTVSPGLQQLTATWPVQPNADPVMYEVHLGMASGFIPTTTTLLGETSGTFWITDKKPNNTKLDPGTTHFMRVVAKDKDGKANPGAQGSGIPDVIDLGDAGDLQYANIKGDGFVPPTPAAPVLSSGIGYIYARWIRPGGADPLTYDVHVATTAFFVPDANTLSLTTTSLFAFIRRQGPGAGNADLVYGTTYYVKLVARDVDGVSQPGPAASGFTVQTNTADIAAGAIKAGSLIVATGAIGNAQIADLAVTTAKIGDGQISTAKIGDAQIISAKIGDGQILNAKIGDLQVTNAKIGTGAIDSAKIGSLVADKIATGTLNSQVVVAGSLRTSYATRHVAFNAGGIFMYNDQGTPLVAINASNGTAYFRGDIFAVNGTFTGNISSSATIRGGAYVGATFMTAESGGRRIIIDGNNDSITFINDFGNVGGFIRGAGSGGLGDSNAKLNIHGGGNSDGFVQVWGRLVVTRGIDITGAYGPHSFEVGYNTYWTSQVNYNGNMNGLAYYNGAMYYHPNNPPPSQQGQFVLNDGDLRLRGANDINHTLQYGAGYGDGPMLTGFGQVLFRVLLHSSSSMAMRIDGNADLYVGGSGLFNRSSQRYKQNIATLEKSGVETIRSLRPVTFRNVDIQTETNRVGVIAEEVYDVAPELVMLDNQGRPDAVNYSGFTPHIIKAIQELADRVDALEPVMPVRPPRP